MANIAVIGCGHWGPNLIRNFSILKEARVIYVCDLDDTRLKYIQSIYPTIEICRDYKKTLEDKKVDAVCIATPANTHFEIAKEALLSGKHVLLEKPMTLSFKDARELVKTAKDRKRVLMVGNILEYNEIVKSLKKLISKGELGKIFYINMTRANWGVFRKDTNVIWDLCPHDISILNYILGIGPIAVRAEAKYNLKEDIQDLAFIALYYPKELIVHSYVSWLEPLKNRKIIIAGSKKTAIFDDLDAKVPLKIYEKDILKKTYFLPKNAKEPLFTECRHFLDCLKYARKPQSDGESGLKIVKILDTIQKSANNGGKIVSL